MALNRPGRARTVGEGVERLARVGGVAELIPIARAAVMASMHHPVYLLGDSLSKIYRWGRVIMTLPTQPGY
jgi:hypothetical protein